MSNIKVNITNWEGKRTSTTINYTIAVFYCEYVLGHDCHLYEDGIYELVGNDINDFIKERGLSSKEAVEKALLLSIYNADPQKPPMPCYD